MTKVFVAGHKGLVGSAIVRQLRQDGQNNLLDIANKSEMPFGVIKKAADALAECDLLRKK